jgi:TRAP-type C4-dicarboxylate transport system permease large subunit
MSYLGCCAALYCCDRRHLCRGFYPTEAAGIGAFGTFLFSFLRKRLTWAVFKESLSSTLVTTGMLFLIMMGAMIFGYFLSVSQLPSEMATFVGGLSVNRYIILAVILFIILMLGCIMDSMAIVLLTIPVFYRLLLIWGLTIWFGILVVRVTEMGMITPPVGMNVFVIKGISDTPIGTIFRGIVVSDGRCNTGCITGAISADCAFYTGSML